MEKSDVSPSELHSIGDSARLRMLLGYIADRAREYYRARDELIPLTDEDSQPALWVLITIYLRLLEKISLRQYDVFKQKVSLTTGEKLVILGKGLLKRLG